MTLRYSPETLLRGEIDWTAQADGKVLAWSDALGKFQFVDQSGGTPGGSAEYTIVPVSAANTPCQPGIPATVGMAPVTPDVSADAVAVLLGVTALATAAGTANVVFRDETNNVDLWNASEAMTAGLNSFGTSVAIADWPAGFAVISVTVTASATVVVTSAQLIFWVY